jgi:CelD/BcsL family acetyltransferase involved in cellulose biosynthesis
MTDTTVAVLEGHGPEPARLRPAAEPVILPHAAARPVWRQLERSGHLTPYQSEAWVNAWAETLGRAEGAEVRALIVSDSAGQPLGLLPLALTRRFGITIARMPGGKHANFAMPVLAKGAPGDPAAWRGALLDAGRMAGIDLFALDAVPTRYEGVDNPLAACCGVPALSHAYSARLAPDLETFLKARMSGESRKKLRAKERKLAYLGTLSHEVASDDAAINGALTAFLAQKSARFRAQGIADPFESAAAQAFLARAATGVPTAPGRLHLHVLRIDARIVAVFGVVRAGGRASAMFTSFDPDPAIARFSPGEVLLATMIGAFCAEGLTTFDLGVGDGAYKRDYCETVETLTDVRLPVTALGALGAAGLGGLAAAKRAIKANPRLMTLAEALTRR